MKRNADIGLFTTPSIFQNPSKSREPPRIQPERIAESGQPVPVTSTWYSTCKFSFNTTHYIRQERKFRREGLLKGSGILNISLLPGQDPCFGHFDGVMIIVQENTGNDDGFSRIESTTLRTSNRHQIRFGFLASH